MTIARNSAPRDSGFTLIELIVASGIGIVILTIVGGIFVGSFNAAGEVRTLTQATTDGQTVARSVADGVRNATGVSVTTDAAGAQFVTIRTASPAASLAWHCQAWYYSPTGNGSIYTKSSPTAITAPGSLTGWTLLVEGVSGAGASAVFTKIASPHPQVGGLELALNVKAGDGQPALTQTTSMSRQPREEGAPCF